MGTAVLCTDVKYMMSDFLQLMTWQFQFNNNNNENNDKDKFPFTSLIGEMSCPQKI